MVGRDENPDLRLVRECLPGSQEAWAGFCRRYTGLVRTVVTRHLGYAPQDVEDATQNVFVALIPALSSYNPQYSLPRYICMVAERVCIDEYRRLTAGSRRGEADPVDHHDCGEGGGKIIAASSEHQEDQLAKAQLLEVLRRGLRTMGRRCRELLRLRYFEELPYSQISEQLGESENTLMVQSRRCLDELRAWCQEIERKGVRK